MLLSEYTVLQHIEAFYTQLNLSHHSVLLASSITIVAEYNHQLFEQFDC